MVSNPSAPTLADLDYIPYLNDQGQLPDQFEGKVGVYAIFDADQTLQYVGYSRNVTLSLKQHLVRAPHQCYWLKVQTTDRPSRTLLEEIRTAWIAENGSVPAGNGVDEAQWNQPIDAKVQMTDEEKEAYQKTDEMGQIKVLKKLARRVEAQVLETLEDRGVQLQIRFDPKLKEEGLLSVK